LRLSRAQGGKPRRLGVSEPRGVGIEKFVVKHRLKRGEIAAAHRCVALVLEGEDFLIAAHRQTSLAVSPPLRACASLPSAFIRSPRRPRRSPPHSGLIFANLITFAHRSVSSTMSLWNSAGDIVRTGLPRFSSRPLIFGSARAALTSRLSRSTISLGCGQARQFQTSRPPHSRAPTDRSSGYPAVPASASPA